MRIVVSGTHAVGKSTLVSDFALAHPTYVVLPDPFELVDEEDAASAWSFVAQLHVAAERLTEWGPGSDVVAERGPLDLLAYLRALDDLGRGSVAPGLLATLEAGSAEAMGHVDLLVVLPLDPAAGIWVPDDEDPELREAMDAALLDLVEDPDLVGAARVLELTGPPEARLARLTRAVDGPTRPGS
ncbi:AAA family ATPase [Oryzobacter telluris]|uniref:AAA family ATPase n=1 Tax=Oryzobacter telluris TaxID=3149179 RepID=UPI00370D066A